MKRVAIVLDEMSIGGIPKACVDFANQLREYCEVVLLMKNTDGELMKGLSEDISVKIIQTPSFKKTLKKLVQRRKYLAFIKYIFSYFCWTRLGNRWVKANALTAKIYGIYEEDEYDCVIAYHGMNISQLLTALYGVNARKKVAWIHGDHLFEGINKQDILSVYNEFDKIYCVSPFTRNRFLSDFPFLSNVVDTYKNLLHPNKIKYLAKEIIEETIENNCIKIVTVGRVSKEKGQEMIPEIVSRLRQRGIEVRWYIVGDGDDLDRIKQMSYELKVNDAVHFLGAKTNPYPYMKMCDIYVQTSYTEGYCLTACEASILGKAIVLTEITAAAAGIFENEKNAIVVQTNVDSLVNGIEKLIREPSLKKKMQENVKELDLSNSKEINKLLDFINE